MAATGLLSAFQSGLKVVGRNDDDGYDRLSSRHSIALILACALFIGTKSYVGDPIDCWEPQEFSEYWVEYMDHLCWVSNTYYVPMDDSIPTEDEGQEELQYYQWVPLILVFQAFLFAIPTMVWDAAVKYGGYDVDTFVEAYNTAGCAGPVVSQMTRYLQHRRAGKNGVSMGVAKRKGIFLYSAYLFVKVLYIVNAVLQLFFLMTVLGDEYGSWGPTSISDLYNNREWSSTPIFPRVTLCSFKIRKVGTNVQRYTVQCLLPVNLFNEKVFMILWWWLILVAVLSTVGLLQWLLTATLPSSQTRFVEKYLILSDREASHSDIDDFANNFLRLDGVFSLRILKKNTNDLVCGDVISDLWDFYVEHDKSPTVKEPLLPNGRESGERLA